MFWNYGITSSAIDKLLENDPPPKLKDILMEMELIQELKSQNEKLIQFLSESDNFNDLIQYIVTGNDILLSKMSCEVLTSNIPAIEYALLSDSTHVSQLWSVIREKSPNIDAFSYCVRVFTNLINLKSNELLGLFIEAEINFAQDMLTHISSPSICDLILGMINNRIDENSKKYHQSFINCCFPVKLIYLTSPGHTAVEAQGAAVLISEILRFIRMDNVTEDILLFELYFSETLLSDDVLDLLIRNLILAPTDSAHSMACANILNNIFNLQRSGCINGDEFFPPNNIPPRFLKFSKQDYSKFIVHIESLVNIITRLSSNSWNTPAGTASLVFGRMRLQILDTLVSLILYNNEELAVELSRFEITDILMDLFEKYPENNMLHSLVESAITSILLGVRWKSNTSSLLHVNEILLSSLFKSNHFIEKLIHLSSIKASYSAHVTEIMRSLRKASNESYHQKMILSQLSELPDNLKELLTAADDKLSLIDDIESIDPKFALSANEEYDFQNDYFGPNPASQFMTVQKALEIIQREKAARVYEDMIDSVENKMYIETDSTFATDPFTSLSIELSPLSFNFEPVATVSHITEETIDSIFNTDLSSTSSHRSASASGLEEQIHNPGVDRKSESKHSFDDDSNDKINFDNYLLVNKDYTDNNLNLRGRYATSSPVNLDSDLNTEDDTFEGEHPDESL